MEEAEKRLSLDRPATYQIRMPGHLDESWSDWTGGMTITVTLGCSLGLTDSSSNNALEAT